MDSLFLLILFLTGPALILGVAIGLADVLTARLGRRP